VADAVDAAVVAVVVVAVAVEIKRFAFFASSRCAKAQRFLFLVPDFPLFGRIAGKFRIISVFIRVNLWLKSFPDADDAAH
jgi:hypothetical protein